jgi:hypothetical protein
MDLAAEPRFGFEQHDPWPRLGVVIVQEVRCGQPADPATDHRDQRPLSLCHRQIGSWLGGRGGNAELAGGGGALVGFSSAAWVSAWRR